MNAHALSRSCLIFSAMLVLAGCGGEGIHPSSTVSPIRATGGALQHGSPVVPPSGAFFPLIIGNRWRYDETYLEVFVPRVGDPDTLYGPHWASEQRFEGRVSLGGVEYVLERDYTGDQPIGPYGWPHYLRQDQSGLYEADVVVVIPVSQAASTEDLAATAASRARSRWVVPTRDPAKRAALAAACDRLAQKVAQIARTVPELSWRPGTHDAGAPPELTRLRYPLAVGSTWVMRSSPLYTAQVEAFDVLTLRPGRLGGWRIRLENPFMRPGDSVHVWYGASGYLGLHFLAVAPVVPTPGDTLGTLLWEQTETLSALSTDRHPNP